MLILRAELREVKTGDTNYLHFKTSYYSTALGEDVPQLVSVMVDKNDVSKLSELKTLVGTVVEIPVKALVTKEKKRLFYVTSY